MKEVKEIKEFKILKFLDKFKSIFEKTGINYTVMRRLLQLMLIMDGRKTITAMANKDSKDNKEVSPFKSYLISYGIIGLLIMVSLIVPYPVFYKMSIVFGMIIFMVMTTMISDFSTVLLDIKDKIILVPRPIDSKTLNTAKTLHILIYLATITAVIAGPSLIAGTIIYGALFFIIFLVQLVFVTAFVIFLTSILYYLILHFFDGEKLKDIINYFQILLSIVMTIGYQFIGRVFDIFKMNVTFSPKWWVYLIPPVWFAAPYSIFIEHNRQYIYILLSILSVLIPVLLLVLYYSKVSPYFERNLQKLASTNEKKAGFIEKKKEFKRKLWKILCPERVENAFFRFTCSMISNERQLKLKLYPNLAYAAVFPLITMFSGFSRSKSIASFFTEISRAPYYLTMYISVILLSGMFTILYTSENYKGAWIYKLLPVESPSQVYRGFIKGYILKCIFPVFLFVGIIFFMIYGINFLPHFAAMFINLIILNIISFKIYEKSLPFSLENYLQQKQKGGCLIYIIASIYCGVNAGIEYFLGKTRFGLPIYIAVLLITMASLWKVSFKMKWDDIAFINLHMPNQTTQHQQQ